MMLNWTDAKTKELLSVEDNDQISRQISGKDKDSFNALPYFQHSCLNIISSLVHVWSGKFKGKFISVLKLLCVKVVDVR